MSAETLTLGAPREGTFLLRVLVSVVIVLGIVVLLSDLLAVGDVVMTGPDRPRGGATREQISQAGIKVVRVSVLVAAAVLPTGARLVTAARARLSPNILGAGILAVVLLVLSSLATLPVAAWGHSDETVQGWLPDWLIAHAQLWVLGTAVVVSVIWTRPHWPGSWHWRLALAGLCLAAAVPLAADLDPLGDARRPLPEGTAQGAVSGVLDRAGSGGLRIEVGTGTAVDELGAYVTGLGAARAMVLSEAVLSFPTAHVAFVAAHELAHAERRDVNRLVLASGAGMVATLGLLRWVLTRGRRPSQEHGGRTVAVVLAVVAVAHLALTPVANARSRASELLADQRALELTGDPVASIELQRWLVSIGAAEETYPVWYGSLLASHPSAGERIAQAVTYAGSHGITMGDRPGS